MVQNLFQKPLDQRPVALANPFAGKSRRDTQRDRVKGAATGFRRLFRQGNRPQSADMSLKSGFVDACGEAAKCPIPGSPKGN